MEHEFDFFEQRLLDLKRKGDYEKVKFLESLHKRIMPSQVKRIQDKDKSVLQELFLPKWLSWELLFAWASGLKVPEAGRVCVLCNERNKVGVEFKEKFICENCFIRIKQME